MAQSSSGLLMCRKTANGLQFFLVHPGGPYFKKKDLGAWTIPKGLVHENESNPEAAVREFREETGIVPQAPFYELGHIKQKSGKAVFAWAFMGSWDPGKGINSNTFTIEWPPRSGKQQKFPEVDQASWFNLDEALGKILIAQQPLLHRAVKLGL